MFNSVLHFIRRCATIVKNCHRKTIDDQKQKGLSRTQDALDALVGNMDMTGDEKGLKSKKNT